MVVCFSSAIFSCASSGIKAQELNLSSINFFFFAGQIQPKKKQRNWECIEGSGGNDWPLNLNWVRKKVIT